MMTLRFLPMLSFLAIESSGGLFVVLFFEVFPSALSGSFTVFFNSLFLILKTTKRVKISIKNFLFYKKKTFI